MKDNALDVSSGAPPGAMPSALYGGAVRWHSAVRVLRSSSRGLSSAIDDLVTTTFPADCRVCSHPLLRAEASPFAVPVCNACLSGLRPQSHAVASALCRCCGEALGMESDRFGGASLEEGLFCTPCRRAPPAFERAVAYGVYENELREMLHLLKYDGVRSLAKPLAVKLAQAILLLERETEWSGNAAVVAVPLFRVNEKQRGFNQAEALANEAIATLRKLRPGWKLTAQHGLLRRVKLTESQFNLSDKGRRRNMVGAFKVQDDGNTLLGRDVLLIDDILTTGATARACAQVLWRAGVRRVWVATLARAQREQVALWSSIGDGFG